jgi:nicotinate-nucleotide adenylyltransferase
MPDKGPLGILGGTFDPVHTAHLRLAEEAMAQLGLASVLWLPAGSPPHRAPPQASAADRLAMLQLAVAGRPAFVIDEAELASPAPSYTVPTLERLRSVHGKNRALVLLLGADAFLGLPAWHRWREIFLLSHVAVVSRPGFDLSPQAMNGALAEEFRRRQSPVAALAAAPAGNIVPFAMAAGTVSATDVRTVLQQRGDARQLLPAPVLDYISRHALYRPNQ